MSNGAAPRPVFQSCSGETVRFLDQFLPRRLLFLDPQIWWGHHQWGRKEAISVVTTLSRSGSALFVGWSSAGDLPTSNYSDKQEATSPSPSLGVRLFQPLGRLLCMSAGSFAGCANVGRLFCLCVLWQFHQQPTLISEGSCLISSFSKQAKCTLVLKNDLLLFTTFSRGASRCLGAAMFCLGWLSLAVLYSVVLHFLAILFLRTYHPYNRKSCSCHCSRQLLCTVKGQEIPQYAWGRLVEWFLVFNAHDQQVAKGCWRTYQSES